MVNWPDKQFTVQFKSEIKFFTSTNYITLLRHKIKLNYETGLLGFL